jgi:tetratricopeptide (TPR) repeat protein
MVVAILFVSLYISPICGASSPSGALSGMDLARILVKKAVAYEQSGLYEEAEAACRAAIIAFPLYADSYTVLGLVLSRSGQYRESLLAFDRAIILDSRDSRAWYYRGVAFQRLHRYDEAKRDFDYALMLNPTDTRALVSLGEVLLVLRDYSGAIKSFETAATYDPSDGSAFAGWGESLFRISDLPLAEKKTIKALELYPDNLRAWGVMAEISSALGKDDWAAYYRRTADEISRYMMSMPEYAKALSLQRFFSFKMALSAYDAAIRRYPQESVVWTGRAEVLKELGCPDESLRSYDRAVTLDPENSKIRIQRNLVKGMIGGV